MRGCSSGSRRYNGGFDHVGDVPHRHQSGQFAFVSLEAEGSLQLEDDLHELHGIHGEVPQLGFERHRSGIAILSTGCTQQLQDSILNDLSHLLVPVLK